MTATINEFRRRLEVGELVLGLNARHSRTTEVGPLLKDCGFHWMMLDDEHSPLNPALCYETFLAANRVGIQTFMRARRNEHADIGVHLSNGAMGIFIPHVDTEEQARAAANACRYGPVGHLSVPGFFPQLGYRPMPFAEATKILNEQTVVVCMIESPEAVDNIEAIAAVDGVDVLFIGASDLTYEMGIGGQYDHERVRDAVERVCTAARKNGKYAGIGGIKSDELWRKYIDLGIQVVMTESDLSMLANQVAARAAHFDELHKSVKA